VGNAMYMMVCVGGHNMGVGGRWGRQVGISRGHRPESLINKGELVRQGLFV